MKKILLILCSIIFIWSCEAVFIDDISSETVILLAPKNDSQVVSGIVQFNWEGLLQATEYRVQIATPDFVNAHQILLDSTLTSPVISKNLDTGNYQWRVKAINTGYETDFSTASLKVN